MAPFKKKNKKMTLKFYTLIQRRNILIIQRRLKEKKKVEYNFVVVYINIIKL